MYDSRDHAGGEAVGASAMSWLLAGWLVPTTSAVLALADPRLRHWFLIPVTVCGVLIGIDAFEWLRRRHDMFDPQAILGLLGFHFYYLAPILHVRLDYWARYVLPPAAEWRDALGAMAVLNVVGLCLYRMIVSFSDREARPVSRLALDETRFYRLGVVGVLAGVLAFLIVMVTLGGPDGFLDAMTRNRAALAGRGWLLLLGEAFPMLLFCLVAVRWRAVLRRRRGLVVLLLVGLVVVQFGVGGLRGSRSSVLWPLVLGLIVVHYLIFSISRKAFLAAAAVVVVFVYGYGLYKGAGVEVVDVARGTRSVEEVSAQTGRDLPTVLLGDLARADVHALVLDRERTSDRELSYGSTYLAAPLSLVPRWLLDERPRDKVEAGTDLLYGSGVYDAGLHSDRVYGLAGEAIINFGPAGGLLSFVALGLFLRFARRRCRRARQGGDVAPKLLCLPLCAIPTILVTADLDNVLNFFVGKWLPIAFVVWCASTRVEISAANLLQSRQLRRQRMLLSKQI